MQQPLPFSRDASRKTTATIECSKGMVGRVIGKNGDTIKALQNYTGSLIQVNQVDDPCQITISGTQQSLALAMSMVADIVRGTFKGFALLRQLAGPPLHQQHQLPRPIYAPGYGLIPSTQFFGSDGLPRDSAEGAIPISAIDPAALMGLSGMGVPEPWQHNNGMAQQQQQLTSYGLPSLPPNMPPSNYNPYSNPQHQGAPQQAQYHGGANSMVDPYGLAAALYARQGMSQQDAFLAANGGYQDLGPLLAAASANATEDQLQGMVGPQGMVGSLRMPPQMAPGGRMVQAGPGGMGGQPHLPMMEKGTNGQWLGYPHQIIPPHVSGPGLVMGNEGGVKGGYAAKAEGDERQALVMAQAQQMQMQVVSDLMAQAKLNDDPPYLHPSGDGSSDGVAGLGSNTMRRDADGNYYFNNAAGGEGQGGRADGK